MYLPFIEETQRKLFKYVLAVVACIPILYDKLYIGYKAV
jgi:hypothetical protein